MYTLTLTHEERKAIDWVGYRYSNGDDLYKLLCSPGVQGDENIDWSDNATITFQIPEHIAWKIKENAESEDGFWPCFAQELTNKMQDFIDNII